MTARTQSHTRVAGIEFGRTEDGDPFFKVMKLVKGRLREYWFPLRDYRLARDEIVAALKVGRVWSADQVWNLYEGIVETIKPLLSVPTQPGLHKDCFVLPNGEVLMGLPWRVFLPSVDHSPIDHLDEYDGELEELIAIPDLAHGNPFLIMAVAFALTGPVAGLLGIDAPRIQLIGSPGRAMSAIVDVAATMWRRSRAEDAGYAQSWNQPQSVLRRIAAERVHTIMVIDDIATAREGDGAGQKTEDAESRACPSNESLGTAMGIARGTPIFSISTDISAARARRDGAVRGDLQDGLIHIALDGGQSWFEELHDYPDEARFLSALNRQLRKHCGFMAHFILGTMAIWRESEADLLSTLHTHRDEFLQIAQNAFAGNGDNNARHEAFATIFAAAATFLVDTEHVPWALSDITESLLVCEAAAIKTATEGW